LTDPPPGQPRLIGADASHAWLSVFCPPLGWFDFDPTNNEMPRLRHVTIGWGRDYSDVRPIQGVFQGGGQQTMSVSVDVSPT
jgi:transglutaminase-like putative cysteine protease